MRIKKLAICSASLVAYALFGGAAIAQTAPPADPPADEAPNPDPAPDPAEQDASLLDPSPEGEIVVTGIRRSIQSSQTIKRSTTKLRLGNRACFSARCKDAAGGRPTVLRFPSRAIRLARQCGQSA